MKPYVECWENILLHLFGLLPYQNATVLDDVWFSSNWKSKYYRALLSTTIVDDDPKDPILCPYRGLKNMRPSTAYTPFRDFNGEDFVIVIPHDLGLVHVWMGIIESDVVKDEENAFFKMVRVQRWVLMKKGANMDERHLYQDCWN
jgi:hypothetical protein